MKIFFEAIKEVRYNGRKSIKIYSLEEKAVQLVYKITQEI